MSVMKRISPTPTHKKMRDELIAVIRKYGKDLKAEEILALAAYTVGQIIALQDQRTTTVAAAMEIISTNIEAGNQDALRDLQKVCGLKN
jgi:hypothetical protein